MSACTRIWLNRLAATAGLAGFILVMALASRVDALSEPATKRVEDRGPEVDSTARPAGAKPSPPGTEHPGSKPECETVKKVVVEETTTVEETQVIKIEETVILERPIVVDVPASVLTFEEVLQNTLGKAKVSAVIACTDGRSPLPGYAFVGIQPRFEYRSARDTVRLHRFECELEASASWHPSHSTFTFAIGSSVLPFTLEELNSPTTRLVQDVASGRVFPLSIGISKRIHPRAADRYLLSIQCNDAGPGRAPRLLPEDGIFVSVDPSPTAPPNYEPVKLVLVDGREDTESSLRLVEKTGSAVTILPSLSRLDLAAYCSVLHVIPQ